MKLAEQITHQVSREELLEAQAEHTIKRLNNAIFSNEVNAVIDNMNEDLAKAMLRKIFGSI